MKKMIVFRFHNNSLNMKKKKKGKKKKKTDNRSSPGVPDGLYTSHVKHLFHLRGHTYVVWGCCCSLNRRRCDRAHGGCPEKYQFSDNQPTLKHDSIPPGYREKTFNQRNALTCEGMKRDGY